MNKVLQASVALTIIASLLVFGLQFAPYFRSESMPSSISTSRTIEIKGKSIRVAVADTDALRAQGLSGYAQLADDEGMLFVFDTAAIYPFWMKDMLFPIDILWLDAAGRIVHIESDVRPESYPSSFTPDSPARYVLELRAGSVQEYDIRIGESANLEE